MPRIVHIALKVPDLEKATKFYATVFGFKETKTSYDRGHVSRHMTDGNLDLALMVYDSEDVEEAKLSGPGPCIHHWGIEVDDRDATAAQIEAGGGKIISREEGNAWKFRAPDGTVAEIVKAGRYKKKPEGAARNSFRPSFRDAGKARGLGIHIHSS
jgi:lactoylglutathione lyase